MRFTFTRGLALVIAILLVVGAVVLLSGPGRYKVTAFLPAGNPLIIDNAPVLINGFARGEIENLVPAGPGAEITLSIDDDAAPLHTGAVIFTQWSSTVGDRNIELNDGPASNPEIPDGGRIEGKMPKPMEISDTLRGLDAPTRANLAPLVARLRATLAGKEQDLNATIRTAGPAFTAIGNVFRGIAIDQPAINQLVSDTNELVARVASRQDDLSGIVNDLSTSTRDTATVRAQLRQVLQKLPPTLDQARSTLAKVPSTTDAAVPLLDDAANATDPLPSVSRNLAPVLRDLRPTIGELKPTLRAASRLLDETPGLFDSAAVTVPKTSETFDKVTPTLRDVKPFTPCAVSFLSTWASANGYGDANGQFVRVPIRVGPLSVVDQPSDALAGLSKTVSRTCERGFVPGGGRADGPSTDPAAFDQGGLN